MVIEIVTLPIKNSGFSIVMGQFTGGYPWDAPLNAPLNPCFYLFNIHDEKKQQKSHEKSPEEIPFNSHQKKRKTM